MSAKDLYTIQEFSQLSGVEASTLRYWDDIGLFSPIKRNPENNYRYYGLTQILALNFVTVLSELDFPLKTIAELRQSRDPERILEMLDRQEKEMDMEMQRLRLRYSIIHARRDLINKGMKAEEAEIHVANREDIEIMLWPRNVYKEDETFIDPLVAFINEVQERHINLSFPVGGYYDDFETFRAGTDKPQHFISIDPIGTHRMRAGEYLTGFARGYYGEMGDLPERLAAYAKENGYTMAGPVYAIYPLDEISMQNPSEYLAQVLVTVTKPESKLKRQFTLKRKST